ncbi:hypothetical protein H9Q10_06395 [Eikenella sp. S3360]|uniref:Uncharacterized protein n=1 Tax=Eikenella glucosivorans TaxID=2766967 RepID=A0ABS0NAJ4_9NEIS|nr:hypothetical protein [Eikenella glucosivorans]MBH5329298.1 hypothetical protein [Eikenella glucosivorans]
MLFTPSDLGKLIVWGGLLGIALLTLLAMRGVLKKTPRKNRFWAGLLVLIAVPYSCISPLVRDHQRAQQKAAAEEAEWQKRYEPAKERFDQLCQNAGEKIYRTAENVDGILLLKVRGDDEKYQDSFYNPRKDQMWEDAAIESESKREEYVASFLPYYSSVHYDNVDVLQKDGSIIRYSGNWSRYAKPFDQETNPRYPARYAVTYENDVSWENRKHWIAGTTIKIIDTKTNELMAEKTMYVFVPALGYSKLEQNPNPWGRGERCPRESEFKQQTINFVKKVLISPSFKPEARQ